MLLPLSYSARPRFYAVGKELKQWLYHSSKSSRAIVKIQLQVIFMSRLWKFEVRCVSHPGLTCSCLQNWKPNSVLFIWYLDPEGIIWSQSPSIRSYNTLPHWCGLALCAVVYSCRSLKGKSCSVTRVELRSHGPCGELSVRVTFIRKMSGGSPSGVGI